MDKKVREGFFADELVWDDKNDPNLIDQSTGAFNRNAFEVLGRRQFLESQRIHAPLTAVLIDIDDFKTINDTHGHSEGDKRLSQFVEKILSHIRPQDYFYRYGGDEFVLFVRNTIISDVEGVIKPNIMDSLSKSKLSASMGIVQAQENENFEEFIKRADDLMYQEKSKKK